MPGVRGRQLDDLLRSLGSDQTEAQPVVARNDAGVNYTLDQLQFSVPPRSHSRLMMHLIPSAGAAQFSGFDLVPRLGMWVRSMTIFGSNSLFNLVPNAAFTVVTVADALATFPALLSLPESSEYNQQTTNLGQLVGIAAPTYPNVFLAAQVGRYAAAQTGLFAPAGVIYRDFWVPPYTALEVSNGVANTTVSVQLEIELIAEYQFTGAS